MERNGSNDSDDFTHALAHRANSTDWRPTTLRPTDGSYELRHGADYQVHSLSEGGALQVFPSLVSSVASSVGTAVSCIMALATECNSSAYSRATTLHRYFTRSNRQSMEADESHIWRPNAGQSTTSQLWPKYTDVSACNDEVVFVYADEFQRSKPTLYQADVPRRTGEHKERHPTFGKFQQTGETTPDIGPASLATTVQRVGEPYATAWSLRGQQGVDTSLRGLIVSQPTSVKEDIGLQQQQRSMASPGYKENGTGSDVEPSDKRRLKSVVCVPARQPANPNDEQGGQRQMSSVRFETVQHDELRQQSRHSSSDTLTGMTERQEHQRSLSPELLARQSKLRMSDRETDSETLCRLRLETGQVAS